MHWVKGAATFAPFGMIPRPKKGNKMETEAFQALVRGDRNRSAKIYLQSMQLAGSGRVSRVECATVSMMS